MEKQINNLIEGLSEYPVKLRSLRDIVLANLVMLGEIPAPTFREQARMDYFVHRLTENQLLNCSTDEVGNGLGILPGENGDRNILIVAHLDTVFDEKIDHTISIHPNRVVGPAVGDNALGVATLVSLPSLMEELGIKLDSNLILMGSARSLGRGNIEGLRFFLDNTDMPISAGVCVEGVKLGRISYSSIGMVRCEIAFRVPEEYDWTRFGAVGSIVTVNELIDRILEIPLPKRPKTSIVLGSINSGRGFNTIATDAVLRLEIRSESGEMVQQLKTQIQNIAEEVSSHNGSEVNIHFLGQRKPGGISFSHPLAENARLIMNSLGITPRISPSTSELSAFIDKNIPAVTLGITDGENLNKRNESIEIEPIYTGIAQLLGLILAIDRGYCNES
ncbi:M20/M25/M40 family metallo-hydrolase [Sediminispirochaeta smaragdinae]|jgi:acetylornithine deacetylase/succinyl-diaminopimelate desuccinylase-like protein|uniref:Peptidase dimerization domain protein n=1 Tax=Sediminispirochaeta smaragdinae (strain DSM 11293 / JCM 15392 / SEBR 4228) TaxID=573413 RepID=E1R5M0_SEDSS|nr:M20/M25/M40 family metallo-hydrolase [Sediminispirochaeta smaragdinae]ADK82348.1 peptidase dimerization domain protein [Sediminispirochaeta smaragdinae DSM 11293]